MKKIFITFLVLAINTFVHAQTVINDSVSMNPNYADDVYYNLNSGSKTNVTIKNWDLAFCINNMEVGIRVNSINGVNLYAVPLIDTAGWYALDSLGYQSWQELHNSDTSFYYGAFNINSNGGTFDFSWGAYDLNSHEVTGDSLFLIKVTDLQNNVFFKKLWIIKRANNSTHDWVFRYANLDNTNDTTVVIPAANYNTKNFIYYSITASQVLDREPANTDWDVLFTRFTTDIGGGVYYPVAGVYSNIGVEVADVRPVDVSTTNSDAPYLGLYNTNLSAIGYDWKTFNMTSSLWDIEDSLVYFVKTNAGEVYKLVMTGFDGSPTGNIYFNKTLISTSGIASLENTASSVFVYPNPVTDLAQVIFIGQKTEKISYTIYDSQGQKLKADQFSVESGINKISVNTSGLSKGVYAIEINSDNKSAYSKFVKL